MKPIKKAQLYQPGQDSLEDAVLSRASRLLGNQSLLDNSATTRKVFNSLMAIVISPLVLTRSQTGNNRLRSADLLADLRIAHLLMQLCQNFLNTHAENIIRNRILVNTKAFLTPQNTCGTV